MSRLPMEAIATFGYDWYQDIAEGMTGLHLASLLKLPSVIDRILEVYDGSLDTQDARGRTAMHLCATRDQQGAIKSLLDAGS